MNPIKVILILLISLQLHTQIFAQITIDGTISDSELNPISNALVEIIDEQYSTNVYFANTNEDGYFIISGITDVKDANNSTPTDYIILRNYPNPFNPSTIIYFELPIADNIEIKIYDILGREVRTLFNNYQKAGVYQMIWDGRNNFGVGVSAGVYLCRLKTQNIFKVHKMVLLDGGSTSTSLSNNKLNKNGLNSISTINRVFNFTIKVSGSSILETDFRYLTCSSDTTLNLTVPKILQSVTIGPEGGKLETEDFSLTVPAGAFEENVVLNLGIESDSIPVEEDAMSKLFRIDGLPEFYFKDLPVKIKLETHSLDSISIAMGGVDSTFFEGIEIINYDYYHAMDSSGYAVTVLPSPFTNNTSLLKSHNHFATQSSSNLTRSFFLALISPLEAVSKNGNFIFHFPKSKALFIPDIDNYLEDAVDVIELLGFNQLPLRSNIFLSNWPMKVKFKLYENSTVLISKALSSLNVAGRYYIKNNKSYLVEDWIININFSSFLNTPLSDLRRTLGRSVFVNFTNQNFLYGNFDTKIYWLKESLWIWVEELFPKDEYHTPFFYDLTDLQLKKLFKLNVVPEIFNGIMLNSSSDKYQKMNHIIAVSALIKFLAKTTEQKDRVVVDIYNSILAQKSSVGGLIHAMDETENIWWPNFFKEFIQGNIYSVPSEEFLNNLSETIEFNIGDTLKHVDETYYDISAKLFRININSDEIKNNRSLNFKIDPKNTNLAYVKTLVFGLTDSRLIYLSEGIDFSIGNLFEHDALIVCVVNSGNEPPYTGTSNINLDIRARDELPFKQCQIKIGLPAKFKFENADSAYTNYWSPRWQAKGSFKENIFIGNIDQDFHGENTTGTMKVIIDLETKVVTHFEANATTIDSWGTSNWGVLGKTVPLKLYLPKITLENLIKGTTVCSSIEGVIYNATPNEGDREDLISWDCDTTSEISIDFDIE